MIAKVTDNPFQPGATWSMDVEKKLVACSIGTLEFLIEQQDRTVGSPIDSRLSTIFPNSVGLDELVATSNKAALIFFAVQAHRIQSILDIDNQAIEKFYRCFYLKKEIDTMPSKVAEDILNTFKATFGETQGNIDSTASHTKQMINYYYLRSGWQACLPECLQYLMDIKTPSQKAHEHIDMYIRYKTRAEDILSQEMTSMIIMKAAVNKITALEVEIQILEDHLNE